MTMNIIYLACAGVLLLVNVNMHAKFEVSSFTHCKDIIYLNSIAGSKPMKYNDKKPSNIYIKHTKKYCYANY